MFSGGVNISFYAFYTFCICCVFYIFSSYNTFSCTSFYSENAPYIYRDDYGIDYCECASNGHSIHKLHSTRGTRCSILHTRSGVCGWGGQRHILTGVREIKLR